MAAFCQEYNYVHYDVKDGLAGSTVYGIVQDKDGFMWYGTETGLSRFDGTHFKNFYTSDGLPDNEIIKLFVDSKNRVWIIPFKNSICYYWKGKIHNQENDSLLKQVGISGELISINEDSQGNILVSEIHHLYLIDREGKVFSIKPDQDIPFSIVKTGIDKYGKFKIALTVNGHFKFCSTDLKKHELIVNPEILTNVFANSYSTIEVSPALEMYKNNDLLSLKYSQSDSPINIKIPEGYISYSRVDDSLLTINTSKGAYLFDMNKRRVTDTFMIYQIINSVTKDTEENLWFCVPGKGVYRLSSGRFMNYFFVRQSRPVFCIQKFDSLIYVGSDDYHLLILDTKKQKLNDWKIGNGDTRGRITALAKAYGNNIIAGTDNGVFRLDIEKKKIAEYYYDFAAIKSISVESNNSLIISSSRTVVRTDANHFSFKDIIWKDRATCAFSNGKMFCIGTLNGLYIIDSNKKIIYLGDSNNVFRSRINAISKTNDGPIWVATNGSGIVAFKDNKIISNITESDGLTSNICRNIFLSENAIWVGTDKGLNKISHSDTGWAITSFTSADGLNSDIINAVYADGEQIYVGTPQGIAYFNEAQISKKSICNLQITGINTLSRQLFPDSTNFVLTPENNNIEFQFVGISYKSAGKISYQYRLIGLDSNWRSTNTTLLNYTSLRSGKYELQLKAVNKFGVKSNLIKVPFAVAKTIWEQLWFRILMIALIVIFLWLIINYRIATIRKKENEKSETVRRISELEQMALKSQMNPHFIFNCLNSIQHYVIDKDIIGANEFISNFSKLIRLTLDNSSKPSISITDEISYITAYLELEQKRFEDKFTFSIIADGITKNNYFIPPMILQPYVENAIRHGIRYREDNKGELIIKFEKNEEYLVSVIFDNGIGRKLSQQFKGSNSIEYQSRGMDLTARRIEMFNKVHSSKIIININDLEDENRNVLGTEVVIKFPLKEIEKMHTT